jgi:hypothetical protein
MDKSSKTKHRKGKNQKFKKIQGLGNNEPAGRAK